MDEFTEVLKALADENRLKIINLLLTNEFCVGALASFLGISKAAVSQHIQILRKAGLLDGEKRGYWVHYSVNRNLLSEVASKLQFMASQPLSNSNIACGINLKGTYNLEGGRNGICNCNCGHPINLKTKPGICSDR